MTMPKETLPPFLAVPSRIGEEITVTGKWVVLDSRTKEVFGVHQDGAEPINCVKFSPDGSKLAISSRSAVHIYRFKTFQ